MTFSGIAYRAHHPHWSWSPLSGEGARRHGGRFNPSGIEALYLSLDIATAISETSQGFGHRFPPLTLVCYDVDCKDIADLTLPGAAKIHGFETTDLSCAWKLLAYRGQPVPSWELARRMITGKTAGMIVPSFAPGVATTSRNLVLWQWGPDLPHRVRVFDPEGRLAPPTE